MKSKLMTVGVMLKFQSASANAAKRRIVECWILPYMAQMQKCELLTTAHMQRSIRQAEFYNFVPYTKNQTIRSHSQN